MSDTKTEKPIGTPTDSTRSEDSRDPFCSPSLEGRRVIVHWTHRAQLNGADWPCFIVVKETHDGLFLKGCDDMEGHTHDGTHCFAPIQDLSRIEEWPFEENDQEHPASES